MSKTKVTINVDNWVLEDAKFHKVNISRTTEDALRSYLNLIKGDVEAADEVLVMRRLEKKETQLTKIQGEVSALRQTLDKISKMKSAKEDERLEKEKEEIENAKKCINCDKIIPEKAKSHNFDKGSICNSCFLGCSSNDLKRWNNG